MQFHTKRLICSPLTLADKEDYCDLYTNPKVMRKITTPLSEEAAASLFTASLTSQEYRPFTKLTWTIKEAQNSSFVGIQGLIWHNATAEEAEIGIMLKPLTSGRGYPIEGMGALVDFGFVKLGLTKIVANFQPDNKAVEKFVLKLGFVVEPALRENKIGPVKHCFIHKQHWLNLPQRIVAQTANNRAPTTP